MSLSEPLSKPSARLLCFAVVGVGALLILSAYVSQDYRAKAIPPVYPGTCSERLIHTIRNFKSDYNTTDDLPDSRIPHVQSICQKQKQLLSDRAYLAETRYIYSPKYNLKFCFVPKIGSTFWKKIFDILEQGSEQLDEILHVARYDIQHGEQKYKLKSQSTSNQTTVAMTTRNPYSRLFSAYVDKTYLLKGSLMCEKPTFEEHLRDILWSGDITRFDIHERPVTAWCNPCTIKPDFLIKQETLNRDTMYLLNHLDVDSKEQDTISNLTYNLRAENNIPGIVKTMFTIDANTWKYPCFHWRVLAERLWTSFQIQGYIDDKVDFPYQEFVSEEMYSNSTFIIEIMLDTIRQFPLSPSEIGAQRARALRRAYEALDNDIIEQIKEIYKYDFQLFNYSNEPPTAV